MNPGEWLTAVTWRDGLDFALLLTIVYALLRVVRGTRAVPVLVAVSTLGIVAWGIEALDLIASASILKYFFESIIIVLIVVFQQELRRLLLQLGQRLLPRSRREAAQSAMGELVAGLERLQRARVGALVILQGDLAVLDVATGKGIEIDAPLVAETLVALAIPHSANMAHDGAIVVEDFRIARAGVVCPLSEQSLDPRFGTRHRGAIGCTEEIDALALVLSEERAELRIVERGVVSDVVTTADLAQRIAEWLARPREAKWLRRASEARAGDSLRTTATFDRSSLGLERSSAAVERSGTSFERGSGAPHDLAPPKEA